MKLSLLMAISFLIFMIALFTGPNMISPFHMNDVQKEILLSIRLPRVVVAALMGAALGASGAVLQGILKNPLPILTFWGYQAAQLLQLHSDFSQAIIFLANSPYRCQPLPVLQLSAYWSVHSDGSGAGSYPRDFCLPVSA